MTLAAEYAKALYESTVPVEARVKKLREVLKRRGHEKLLPRIYTECEYLAEQDRRLAAYKKITPEKEQTRVLLELYQKLIHTNG